MRALSVRQPWAELIASGRKTIEVRSWATRYRGPLIICAGAGWHRMGVDLHGKLGERGVAVALVELVDCRPIAQGDADAACFPDPTGYAWVLGNAQRVETVPVLGRLSLFTLPADVRLRRAA